MRLRLVIRGMLMAVAFVLSATHAAHAQDDIRARIREASRALALSGPPFSSLDEPKREQVVTFVAGNALFTLSHELGHAVIAEFNLPVLGQEEDAADSFATLALLHVGTDFTHQVLVDAAKGLMLLAARDARTGTQPAFYGEHGLDQQRAYKIVCLMVGSDPTKFKGLAQQAKLPEDRQEMCQADFDQAKTSWLQLLEPHFRAASRPSFWERLTSRRARLFGGPESSVAIDYADAPPDLTPYRDLMRTLRLLEEVRDFAAKNFAFPRRITIEAKACGEPNAYWDAEDRRLTLCYELLAFNADLALRP